MTKQQELDIYKQALKHFRISRFFPFYYPFHTGNGFCRYFAEETKFNFWKLEILYSLYENKENRHHSYWWFKYHDMKSRIEVLKTAIATVKQQIEDETQP